MQEINMDNRNGKRNFGSNVEKEMISLIGSLNHFCFHGSGADDQCRGCPFEEETPCPLAVFHNKLAEKF